MGNDVSIHASKPKPAGKVGSAKGPGKCMGKMLSLRNTPKKKTRRGLNKREIKRRNTVFGFSIMGNNANGLGGKTDSLKNTLKIFKPSCVTIQETKLRTKKFEIPGYQVFLKNRQGLGGGLLTAVEENLAPVLVSSQKF